jgi:hypothetical protein
MSTPYHSAVVDTRFEPLGTLLQYVEGRAWPVDYYQQVLGRDDELSPQQLNVSAPFQQYTLIRNMELKVTQTLRPEQDPVSKTFTSTGVSTTYPLFIPNAGDMFLADAGDGRLGVFAVTKSTKMTHLRESYYSIEYVFKGYGDTLDGTLEDLTEKTVKTVHFVKDYLNFGQNPLLLDSDYNSRIELSKLYEELVDYYMHENFSLRYQTLIVPDQQFTTYDPFITRFIPNIITQQQHANVGRIRVPSVDQHLAARYPSIWDVLTQPNIRLLRNVTHRVRLLQTEWFKMQPLLAGIAYTGIDRVVFPFDRQTDVDEDYSTMPPLVGDLLMRNGQLRWSTLERLIDDAMLDGLGYDALPPVSPTEPPAWERLPDIIPVTQDDFYVFSEHFYLDRIPSTKLEHLTLCYLREEPVDKAVLTTLAQQAANWGNVERFYYIPVLLTMMLATQRRN